MKEIIFDNDGKEEKIYVESAAGYNDGYYWECSATVIYNDVRYSIQDAGSGSGWIPCYNSISVNGPCKLVSLMQLLEKDEVNEDEDIDEWEYIENVVVDSITEFLARGCKESFEKAEADYGYSIHIDGKKVEES